MDFSELQNFDYAIIIVMGLSIYAGWKAGLIRSMIGFFAWFGSLIIVADSHNVVFNFVNSLIHSKFISLFISTIGFYIILVIAFSMLGERVSKTTAKFGGSSTDKITGGIFGAMIGGIIACTIFWLTYMALYALNDQKFPNWFAKAKSYKLLKISSDTLIGVAFSEEERAKLMNLVKKKSNKLEEEVKRNFERRKQGSSDNSEE